MSSRLKSFLLLLIVACISISCIVGCASQRSSESSKPVEKNDLSVKDSTTTDNESAVAISETPAYRMVASVVRDSDKQSGFKYDDYKLVAGLEYGSTTEYKYKDNGLTREEYNNGEDGSVPGTYTSKATVDELGRIVHVSRTFEGSDTSWEFSYTYYDDTMKLKSMELVSSWIRTVEFNEDGYVTSITITNPNSKESKTATFTYEVLEDDVYGMEYTDFEGNVVRYMIGLDENGNVQTIYDGTTYVDYLYEEVENPSAWLFLDTDRSQAQLGYTTRTILDTEVPI